MPYIVNGDSSEVGTSNYAYLNFDYNYPRGLDLNPNSDFHKRLRAKIWARASASRKAISKRFTSWNEIDRIMTTYVSPEVKKELEGDTVSETPISIIFPYSYSNLEALLTYMTMALIQDPIFQYEGVDSEDVVGAMLLELVIRLHCIKNKVPLALHTIFRDAFSYGVGIGLPGWVRRYGKRPIKTTVVTQSPFGDSTSNGVQYVEDLLFEGNDLTSIDPYLWLPDPSVSSDKIQEGEFIGWIDRDNYMNMLSEESYSDGEIFNVRYLKAKRNKKSTLAIDESDRNAKFGGDSKMNRGAAGVTSPVDNINMYVNLIPKEWGLGPGEYPEKWFFRLSADDVITKCEPANHNHGLYPVAVASPEYDGYSATPISRLEVLKGLQNILDWFFSSRVANAKKSLNDMIVVDPYLVNINDVKDPKPGKIIRLRRPAWGHGVKDVVSQLAVNDITRNNISDAAFITQWMDRISGADQSLSGTIRQSGPERLTRGEFQGTRSSAISRLQSLATIISYQFMQDIGYMFAVHTQQYMSKESVVKITGRYEEDLRKSFGPNTERVKVSPFDLAINYDLVVRDGSIPGGNFSDAWLDLFNIIVKEPDLRQTFDVSRIFSYIAIQLGAKNVEDFKRNVNRIQPSQMPDEQVMGEAAKGNLVPLGQQ